MFQMMGVFAEFERSMIQERVRAGLKRAVDEGKQLGRPPIAPELQARIRDALRARESMRKIAARLGVSTDTVLKVSRVPFEGASGGAPSDQNVTSAAPVRVLSEPVRAAQSISGRGRACSAAQAGNAA
jgi:hypothetical protein